MNTFLDLVRQWPVLLLVGIIILTAFYFGKAARRVKLPSLIGFMLLGVFLGPSLLNVLGEAAQVQLSFLTEIALGFVALSIGLELKFSALKQLGKGMVSIILLESFGAFILVTVLIFWITGNLPLALVFGGIAPASAPAGTVAVIQEYKAKGPLTKALYAVVGFDDGLGIILFGFAAAIAKSILHQQAGAEAAGFGMMLWEPMKEVLLSVLFGSLLAFIFTLFARKLDNSGDIAILLTGITFIAIGLSTVFHLSLILTNLIIGMIVVNTQSYELIAKIHERLPSFMP
ncbi:MAG: cation:proton antiporter, partial [Candidatus Marinimicrobia bacterium]|nr:cation:proton antiporter [Candidatus Neomarinimicrobiota bacterium]